MNTKLIMSLSAVVLGVIGILLTFMAKEVAGYLLDNDSRISQILMQVLGALFFAFAMLNWMAKGSYIGGIYNRPIAIANFTHFLVGGLALLKAVINDSSLLMIVWVLAGIYLVFALLFARIVFGSPVVK